MKWAIDTSGYEIHDLANKINVEPEIMETWKDHHENIEFKKLEKLAHYIKRPVAVFFLENPPDEIELLDYRKLPNDQKRKKISHKTALAIRNARYLQSSAAELLKLQEASLEPKIDNVDYTKISPEKVAESERKKFGFHPDNPLPHTKPNTGQEIFTITCGMPLRL